LRLACPGTHQGQEFDCARFIAPRCGSVWRLLMVFLCRVLCFLKRIDDAIRRERDWLVFFIEQHNVYVGAVVAEIKIDAMRFGTR
jgi:hypothetical protein